MLTQEIRRKFLKYFRDHQHTIAPSSPVVPHDDPTLLFINAGMNQFKDVFLGKNVRDYVRAASSQKCIRVGGKHNDLENVGHTLRHLTFFEMLGNFSFGDYFKKEAIQFAWEVSTEVFGLDPERIWPTVFRSDEEAFELWQRYVPAEKITRFDEKNNFWAMGDTGPCGPCSELLYDRGPEFGDARKPIEDVQETRYLEFWNLVFMQYNRDERGVMHPLPKPSIDTGAGLERVINLKMGVESVYDTDVLRMLIAKVEEISGVSYTGRAEAAPFRVIADHLRCLAFAIADGVQPSNVDRGYVLRKVLRRAVRYGRSLGLQDPFLAKVFPTLLQAMGEDYPELGKAQQRIEEILTLEEESFIRTLNRGGNLLGQVMEKATASSKQISGEAAFKLKDTYGFPIEEILLIARDADLSVDTEKYAELEQEARDRSRQVHKSTKQVAEESLFASVIQENGRTHFVGYEEGAAEGKVLALLVDGHFVEALHAGQEAWVILDRTPFYAEMGGQVGDCGSLRGEEVVFDVKNCVAPFKGLVAHVGVLQKGTVVLGDVLMATIDAERRQKIANNHTATHLLHWALASVLGEHVKQAGSVVEADKLRFDFSHHKALTKDELRQIENRVNHKIRENIDVQVYELPYQEVLTRDDIKQFFGEKYDQVVRVIDIDYSKELCGGTHTSATGNIGLFRISKEGSIAAGVRRIEACTGEDAEKMAREQEDLLESISERLKTQTPKLLVRVEKLLEEQHALTERLEIIKRDQRSESVKMLASQKEEIQGISLLTANLTVPAEELREYADALMEILGSGVLVLAGTDQEKCQLMIRVSDDLIRKGLNAKEMIALLAPIIGGGGGGKANSAQAGGKWPEKIPEALERVRAVLSSLTLP